MKQNILSFYSRLLSACFVLLGFGTCVTGCNNMMDMYGSPSASFKVVGKVVSAEGKAPVKGIRVVMVENFGEGEDSPYLRGDTTYTDSEGKFETKQGGPPLDESRFKVKFQDIDGEENGLFEDKEQTIEFKNSDFKNGDGHWYRGEALKDMGSVELKPKKEEN